MAKQPRFAVPPPTEAQTDNLAGAGGAKKDLNFKVEPEFHQEFKKTAVIAGITMNDLLRQAFDLWKDRNQDKG